MKRKQMSFFQRFILTVASGAMVIPLSYLESFHIPEILDVSFIDISIGVVFALFVMVPFLQRFSFLKALVMMIASVAIYTSVAKLAVSHYHLFHLNLDYTIGIITSGAFGALLTGLAMRFIISMKLKLNAYLLLAILGAITGYIFSMTIDSSLITINALGFVTWQLAVFVTLYYFKK